MSIGDMLVQGIQQTPAARLNQPLQGPTAGSGPPGAPAPAGAPPSPQLPGPQSYGPDPSTAASIQALMQMHAQDRAANGIDRGLAGMASAFGPLETRNAIMNSAQPEDDRLHAMAQSILLQNAQTAQTKDARAGAGAEALGVNMGLKPGEGNELYNLGQLPNVAGQNLTQTDDQKKADAAAQAYKAANPNATDEEVNRFKSNILTNQVDPAARAANIEIAKNIAEAKDPATFNKADTQISALQQNIDWFKAHPDATKAAVTDYDWRLGVGEGGVLGYTPLGASPEAKEAKTKLDQMMKQLSGESLANSGMSRMAVQEFSTLGNSMTNLGSKNLPPGSVMDEINRLADQTKRIRANVTASSGRPLDKDLSGYADPRYFDKSSPYYTGATTTKDAPAPGSMGTGALPGAPAVIQSPGDIAKLAPGTPFTIPDGPNKGKTGYAR